MNLDGKVTNPGDLRTLVTLQSPTINKDAGGAPKSAWSTQAQVYAKWVNAHGSEAVLSESLHASRPVTATIRYFAGLNASWAVLKGSDLYQVISVDDIRDRHEYMELKLQIVKGSA